MLDFLESSGELDNTIIVAASDNGASGEGGPDGTFNEWRFFRRALCRSRGSGTGLVHDRLNVH
ncbi:hypothetical protein [Streptomyces sp. UG1]|uniref:hypothetical protein n=1 Tax=Streptomyces sp. UG1 TaxID=3417652 RepID=UPI003CF97C8C